MKVEDEMHDIQPHPNQHLIEINAHSPPHTNLREPPTPRRYQMADWGLKVEDKMHDVRVGLLHKVRE